MPGKKSKSLWQDSELHENLVNYAVKGKVTKVKQCIRDGVNLNKVIPGTPGYNVLFMVIMTDPFTNDHLKVMEVLIANGADASNRAWIQGTLLKCAKDLHQWPISLTLKAYFMHKISDGS